MAAVVSWVSLYPTNRWQCDYSPLHCQCVQQCIGKQDHPTFLILKGTEKLSSLWGQLDTQISLEHLCLCQFSLWSIAEFAKFFPFVTLHLAGPHALFHASVWWVPGWPRGCMHYLRFTPPRIPTFCLYSSRYKILSCSTIGESLCHWDFYGSIPKKEHRNWTGGLAGPKKYSLLMPQANTDLGVHNNLLYSKCLVRQPSIWVTSMEIGSSLKNSHPRMKGCV